MARTSFRIAFALLATLAPFATGGARLSDLDEPTHSAKLMKLLESPTTEASDRVFDALSKVDPAVKNARDAVRKLRVKLLHSANPKGDAKSLAKWELIAQKLLEARVALTAAHAEMAACAAECAQAEMRAADGEHVGHEHHAAMAKRTAKGKEHAAALDAATLVIRDTAKELGNRELTTLADDLVRESKLLAEALALCGAVVVAN
jgi:hypothetical protein